MYTSNNGFSSKDQKFIGAVEPLLLQNKARTSNSLEFGYLQFLV